MLPAETLFTFLIISIAITFTPGPDNLMVLGQSLAKGKRAGIGIAMGCAAGCLTHTLWAALGISALLASSPLLFTILKLAGALYLFWLGIQAFIHASQVNIGPIAGASSLPWYHYFKRGFIANAINPKVALFFLALLPQFTHAEHGPIPLQILQLGFIFALQTILVFGLIAYMADNIGRLLRQHSKVTPWLDRIAGTIFIALALHLALTEKPT